LDNAALEERLTDSLLAAAELLAEALRAGLSEQGLPNDLFLRRDGKKVIIASRSAQVREWELGRAGMPPTALMESIARDSAPMVVDLLATRLKGFRG
jgi:plasmid stabilization system protein ParE